MRRAADQPLHQLQVSGMSSNCSSEEVGVAVPPLLALAHAAEAASRAGDTMDVIDNHRELCLGR